MSYNRYSMEVREKALAMMAIAPTVEEVSQALEIPHTTLLQWKHKAEEDEKYKNLRDEMKRAFVYDAWTSIRDAQALAGRRIARARSKEEELDMLIEEIEQSPEVSHNAKQSLIAKIRMLKVESIKDLSQYIATMVDKQALVQGESTANLDVSVTFEDQLAKLLSKG